MIFKKFYQQRTRNERIAMTISLIALIPYVIGTFITIPFYQFAQLVFWVSTFYIIGWNDARRTAQTDMKQINRMKN
jgi:hypothetical protein